MPPSPSPRRSPARELRTESIHKRGRSFERGVTTKAKDDDLVLFNEMQNRESESFLLHVPADFNDSINFNLGINIPARGESSDLLNADSEKNDYDWLLTPPDTPLFPSLDDDGSQQINFSRGRTRNQAISLAKPSMNEKTPRTSRSSASPHRLSPTPRTINNVAQSRSSPSSVPRSSPPPIVRPPTLSRRPSTPPSNNTTPPTARSSTPTMRRMSTGSSGSKVPRGTSPIKTNRGNSASPKLRGWQPDVADLSSDAPPNLRTSLCDRSASRIRGFSPASTSSSGRKPMAKCGRNSISPSAQRSGILSRSLEQVSFASYSRVSVASSGDDEEESMPSINAGASDSSSVRKHGAFAGNKLVAFSKKSSRSPSANSALKRSFDSAIRQMDNLKAPHNMFRPLLSSVPATTFYSGKPNSVHRILFSRNSSLTTSSNGSSEQGASFAPDVEYIDHDQNDLAWELEKVKDTETEDEIFIFDKLDESSEGNNCDFETRNVPSHEAISGLEMMNEAVSQELESSIGNFDHPGDALHHQSDFSGHGYKVDCKKTLQVCSKCGKQFLIFEMHPMLEICEECAAIYGLLASEKFQTSLISTGFDNAVGSQVLCDIVSLKLCENKNTEVEIVQDVSNNVHGPELSIDKNSFELVTGTTELYLCKGNTDCIEQETTSENGGGLTNCQLVSTAYQDLRVGSSEGTGISVLLMQKSTSSEWPVLHGRTFSASNMLCSEPSYVRDNTSTMKHNFSRQSSSPSSSVDFTSSRPMGGQMVHQLSRGKDEIENIRSNNNVLACSSDSHSESSKSAEPRIHVNSESDECSYSTLVTKETCFSMHEKTLDFGKYNPDVSVNSSTLECSSLEHAAIVDGISIYSETSGSSSNLYAQSNQQVTIQNSENTLTCSFGNVNHTSQEVRTIERNIPDTEEFVTTPDCSSNVENLVSDKSDCQADISDDPIHTSLVHLRDQEDHSHYENVQNQSIGDQILDISEDFQAASNPMSSDTDTLVTSSESKDILVAMEEIIISEHLVNEETGVVVGAPKGLMQRSFTLEEATDTILFCSSVVHDIAYKAVTIGLEKESTLPEKESTVPEAPRPTVAILGKSVSNQKDFHNIPSKRIPTSRKIKRKVPEVDTKVPDADMVDDIKDPFPPRPIPKGLNTVDSTKPLKLESKCNCTVM